MSKIFKALERAESESRGEALKGVSLSSAFDAGPAINIPEHRQEYEKLKVMLTLAASRSDLKTIMLVSALPGEGVSTVTYGLANAVAEGAHQGVLVVDLSSSKPGLARRLGLFPRCGLAELLTKEASYREAIMTSTIPHLSFLGRGSAMVDLALPHWLDLFAELLADLRSLFDYLLFDGGSSQTSPDSCLVASRLDGVVLVVRSEQTGMEVVRETSDHLRKAGANLLGVVLNRQRQYVPTFIAKRL